jgi:hypothetical protein
MMSIEVSRKLSIDRFTFLGLVIRIHIIRV